jgi:hypothetical protein
VSRLPEPQTTEASQGGAAMSTWDFTRVPDELLNRDHWVNWRYVTRTDKKGRKKTTKPPCDAQGRACDAAKDPPQKPFVQALTDYTNGNGCGIEGVGFFFTQADDFCGVDLDTCRDADTGEIEGWAQKIIALLNSYSEVSPSGSGIKIFLRGKLPGDRRRKGRIEVYDRGRYFTVTGQHLEGTPLTVEDRQEQLSALYAETFKPEEEPPAEEPPKPKGQTKLDLLMEGRIEEAGFTDLSAAVASLLVLLFNRYGDREVVELKFRQSRLYVETHWKEKWERLREPELDHAERFVHESLDARPDVARLLSELNQKFYVVGDLGGKCRVCAEVESEQFPGSFDFVHQSFRDFSNRYSNRWVNVALKDQQPAYRPVPKVWLGHEKRRQYERVIYAPERELGEQFRNLWRGFAYEAKKGDCSLYLQHLKENVCRRSQRKYDWLIRWMAYAVRHPNERGHTCPAFLGGQGVGKNSAADPFAKLWGTHYTMVTQKGQFTGHFNAHLRNCSVLIVNEAFFAGDRSQAGPMKALITDELLSIEAKGVDVVKARNLLHILFCSNEDWVVPADMDVRRFSVFRLGEKHKQDQKYFGKLWEQLERGGYSALLYHLLNEVSLNGFDPRQYLLTDELTDQKVHSLFGIESVWYECLQRGTLPGATIRTDGTATLRGSDLVDWAAKKRVRGWENFKTEHVGHLLGDNPRSRRKGMGFQKDRLSLEPGRPNVWRIPPLVEARQAWNKRRFAVNWEESKDLSWAAEDFA